MVGLLLRIGGCVALGSAYRRACDRDARGGELPVAAAADRAAGGAECGDGCEWERQVEPVPGVAAAGRQFAERAVAALAREGGLPSTLWAGPEKTGRAVREGRHPVQGTVRGGAVGLRLGFGADDFSYAIDFGLPAPSLTAFALDPEIKRECIWHGPVLRPAALLCDRHNGMVRLRAADGTWGRRS
jgi:hypothetical protein